MDQVTWCLGACTARPANDLDGEGVDAAERRGDPGFLFKKLLIVYLEVTNHQLG